MAFEQVDHCPICEGKSFTPYITCEDYTTSHTDFNIVQCDNCKFKVTSPRPTESEIGEYYKSDSYISHSGGSKNLIDKIYLLARSQALKQKRNLIEKYTSPMSLLDYGCGTGDFLNECITHNWKGYGFEPSPDARLKSEQKTKTKIYSDITQVSDNQYDVITMWHVLEHVHKLNFTLEKLTHSLTANGTIFIAVPNPMSWDATKYGKHWAAYDVPRHLWHFSKENIKQLLLNHNLKVKEILPMKLDSYYVSLLSEGYQNPEKSMISKYISGFSNGLRSNINASKEKNHSSLIYIAKR